MVWLEVIGIGEDGLDGLSPAPRALVENAEVIIGGDRHHSLSAPVTAERIAWPSPFDAMIETIRSFRGRRLVILVSGDPLWYSVGARLLKAIPAEEIRFHPFVSAFQLAASRLGWSMADLETVTVHGRPAEQMIPFIQPGQRLLILTTGAETPSIIAGFLCERGFGPSRMHVFAALGGTREQRFDGTAEGWSQVVPEFNTLAVECLAGPQAKVTARVPGLPDDAFRHDGNFTKRDVRSAVLARLMPMRGALLWDIGCGCGTVAVEWMRAGRDSRAIGIEPRQDRRALAAANALHLGTPGLVLVDGTAPTALEGLARPDAVFIGGGLSREVYASCWAALAANGRLVATAVTPGTEALLASLHDESGGELVRIAVQRVESAGSQRLWRQAAPVTLWSVSKP